MREIKFRAWSNRDKCWCGAFSVHKSGLFTEISGARMENGTCVAYTDWIDLSTQKEIVLMQYTGLKDKNGNEIYEGDIVKSTAEPSYPTTSAHNVVFWDEEQAKWNLCTLERYEKGRAYGLAFDWGGWLHHEVVSNICENPNLLVD